MNLLYLGGKKWKSDTMINSVLVRPNTKELLESKGVQVSILEYTDNDTHESIRERAIQSNHDFIFGYSYGAEVASSLSAKGIIMLDLLSSVPPRLINEYFERDYRNANKNISGYFPYDLYHTIKCPVLSIITGEGTKSNKLDNVVNVCYSYLPNSTHLVMVEEGRYQLVGMIYKFMEKHYV